MCGSKVRWCVNRCTAAAFLQKFVEPNVQWAHIDIGTYRYIMSRSRHTLLTVLATPLIAGPAMYSKARDWMPEGGTGFGVQLLTDWIERNAITVTPPAATVGTKAATK